MQESLKTQQNISDNRPPRQSLEDVLKSWGLKEYLKYVEYTDPEIEAELRDQRIRDK